MKFPNLVENEDARGACCFPPLRDDLSQSSLPKTSLPKCNQVASIRLALSQALQLRSSIVSPAIHPSLSTSVTSRSLPLSLPQQQSDARWKNFAGEGGEISSIENDSKFREARIGNLWEGLEVVGNRVEIDFAPRGERFS